MNAQTQAGEHFESASTVALNETAVLTGWGFNADEILSLLWLRQWYQSGGSDRNDIIRHLRFLRMQVQNGELEL